MNHLHLVEREDPTSPELHLMREAERIVGDMRHDLEGLRVGDIDPQTRAAVVAVLRLCADCKDLVRYGRC